MSENVLASKVIDTEYNKPIRTIIEKDVDFVLTAQKIALHKLSGSTIDYIDNVGYLIDKNGNLTRNIDEALILKLSFVVASDKYNDGKVNEWEIFGVRQANIDFTKNGLCIRSLRLEQAQQWLNNHPFPRKNISKMVRGNVYAKYNGHCAYCGCEISLQEMRVDHHIAYMGEGGEDSLDNYYPSCEVCNRVKSNMSIVGFKKAIQHRGEIHRKRKHPIMADSDKIAIKYDLTEKDHEITFYYEKYTPQIDVEKMEALTK